MKKIYYLYGSLVLLAVLSPLGLLASGSAWGEWGAVELKKQLGYAPAGLERLQNLWRAPLAGYDLTFLHHPALDYVVSAVVGILILTALFTLPVWWARGRR